MNHQASSSIYAAAQAMQPVRAQGRVDLRFRERDGLTVLDDLAEGGGYRAKFPATRAGCEAVIINTGGGMTGGDALHCRIDAGAGTDVTVTTQSAEKLYRSSGLDAHIRIALTAGSGARLAWLPQETILFSGARIQRRIEADLAGDADVLLAESMIFGRIAAGEILGDGLVRDRWRIRRDGSLIFADETRFGGDLDRLLKRPAVLQGLRAISTILYISPRAEDLCEAVREATGELCASSGASAWNGMLLARCAECDPARLRAWVARVAGCLHGHALPRVWQC